MKLILIRNNIKDALAAVERAVGEHLNLPVLKNFLLEVLKDTIRLTGTNLEVAIRYSITGKILEAGDTTLPLGVVMHIINSVPSDRIQIEVKNDRATLKTENYEAAIQGIPAKEFPFIPKIKSTDAYVECKAEVLHDALEQVVVATQFSDLRPELNNVFFDFSLDELKLVATDSFRLAEKTLTSGQFTEKSGEKFKLLVPLKTAHALMRLLQKGDTVRFFHDEHQILFQTSQWEFISRLAEGTFPNYTAILPSGFSTGITIKRDEFLDALKLTSVFGSKTSEIKLQVSESKKALELSSSDHVAGENTYLLPAKVDGEPKAIVFNWRYLTDGVRALSTPEVHIGFSKEENKPAVIKSPHDMSYFYVAMPIFKA